MGPLQAQCPTLTDHHFSFFPAELILLLPAADFYLLASFYLYLVTYDAIYFLHGISFSFFPITHHVRRMVPE